MPHKIKVLFRHRSMEMGGVERVLLDLLENLPRDLFDITFFLTIDQENLEKVFLKILSSLLCKKEEKI